MNVVDGLLGVTLVTVHAFVWLRDSLYLSLVWLWTRLVYVMKHKGSKLECIQEDTKKLKKLPLHLALIVHERELSHTDLAKMVTWAFAAGIHNVSVYSSHGTAIDELTELRKALTAQHQQMFSPPLPDVEVYTSEKLAGSSDQSQPEINHEQSNSYSVLVLTPQDGQQNIVTATKTLCHMVMHGSLKTSDIDTTLVNKKLSVLRGFPDPELALVFGDVHSTLGFPPWQMRLTEILFLSSHHKVAYQDFLASIQRYSNCEQRLGK